MKAKHTKDIQARHAHSHYSAQLSGLKIFDPSAIVGKNHAKGFQIRHTRSPYANQLPDLKTFDPSTIMGKPSK